MTNLLNNSLLDRLFFKILSFLSFIYFSTVYFFVDFSVISQILIVFLLLFWFFSKKNSYFDFILLLIISFGFIWQGFYFLNLTVLFLAYKLSFDLDESIASDIILTVSFTICLLSFSHFYFFNSFLFKDLILYPHYFGDQFYRLIGLDSSPTFLTFIAGLSAIIILTRPSFAIKRKIIYFSFYMFIILLCAGRTAIIGLFLALFISLLKNKFFTLSVLIFLLFPIITSYLYINTTYFELKVLLELITSHRIVNWSNLISYYYYESIYNFIFGVGKPILIDAPLFDTSESLLFEYVPIDYAESAILKLLVYHGTYSLVFFIFILFSSLKVKLYKTKLFISYYIFCSIFYDSVISLQYIFITIFIFKIIINDNHKINLSASL